MSVDAVMTNCALLGLTPQIHKYALDYGELNYLLIFVGAEVIIPTLQVCRDYSQVYTGVMSW